MRKRGWRQYQIGTKAICRAGLETARDVLAGARRRPRLSKQCDDAATGDGTPAEGVWTPAVQYLVEGRTLPRCSWDQSTKALEIKRGGIVPCRIDAFSFSLGILNVTIRKLRSQRRRRGGLEAA